jgi:carbonyl reductase 1
VESGRDSGEGWPESVNVPSKIGQVAAARIFAREKAVFVETVSATISGAIHLLL